MEETHLQSATPQSPKLESSSAHSQQRAQRAQPTKLSASSFQEQIWVLSLTKLLPSIISCAHPPRFIPRLHPRRPCKDCVTQPQNTAHIDQSPPAALARGTPEMVPQHQGMAAWVLTTVFGDACGAAEELDGGWWMLGKRVEGMGCRYRDG